MKVIYRSESAVVTQSAAGFTVLYKVGEADWDEMYLPDATRAEAIREAKLFAESRP
jgi:hypothetical protein